MILLWLALAFTLAHPAHAQTGSQSSMQGIVTDPSDAVIVGAAVSTTNVGTSEISTAISDSNGLFRFPVLPPGSYELTVKHPGFVTFIQKNLTLTVGAKVDLAIRLEIAGPTESVKVSSEPPMIETTRTSFSTLVDARSVADLPMNGRNFLSLVALTPGTAELGGYSLFSGQNWMNSLIVDGADHNAFAPSFVGGVTPDRYLFSQEAVQELQVNTNSYSAEFGRAGAGLINVATKSGTNDLHGALFWYYRDRGLNATGLLNKINNQPKDPLHVHQFGGAVGGPIVKNRLFFFANYDGQRRSEQNLTFLNLPSGFTFDPDPLIAAFEQRGLDYLRQRSDPYLRTFNQHVALVKLDWQMKAAHTMSGRWNRHRLFGANFASAGPQQSLEHNGMLEQRTDSVAVTLRSTLSPSKVNVALFSFVTDTNPRSTNSANPEANVFENGLQVLRVGRAPGGPVVNGIRRGEWADTLSFSSGSHSFKFGPNLKLDRPLFVSAQNFSGSYRFNSLESFGRSLAGVSAPVSGDSYIQSFSGVGQLGINVHPNYTELALFAQDEWRARPGLTLNAGVRYDLQTYSERGLRNTSAALMSYGIDTSFVPTDANNVVPRIGIAWSPQRNERLVVRAGYGIFYPTLPAATTSRTYFQNGITVQTRNFRAATSDAQWIPAYPNTICGPPDPAVYAPSCPAPVSGSALILAFALSYRQPFVQQGNFGIEYQIQVNLTVGVTYLGLRGTHLLHWRDSNLAAPVPASIGVAGTTTLLPYRRFPNARPITGFDRVLLLSSDANSNYHGLVIQVTKRFSRGFQFLTSYTFAKVIDDAPVPGPINPPTSDFSLLSDSTDPSHDHGTADYDQRHRFVASGIWELRLADRLRNPAKRILGRWELSGVFTTNSGFPYSGYVNFDQNNDGNAATDRFPGLGRNTFPLPTNASFNLRVSREVTFSKSVRLQAQADAFNLFNRVNVSSVRNAYYSRSTSPTVCGIAGTPCLVPQTDPVTGFGTPITTLDPRILQLSVRILF